jgi:hypothetical protein
LSHDGRRHIFCKRINYGQSEIWLGQNGKDLTPRRTLATNEVLNITRRLCVHDTFQTFQDDYYKAIDQVAALIVPNIEELASEFRLKI